MPQILRWVLIAIVACVCWRIDRRLTALERRAADWDRHFGYVSRFPFAGEWHERYHTKGEIDASWYVPYPDGCYFADGCVTRGPHEHAGIHAQARGE